MIPPQMLAGGAAIAIVAGFLGGWTIRDWKADSDAVAGFERLIKVKDENQKVMATQADGFEAFRQSLEPRTETVREKIKEIYRDAPPVPADCAWSPDVISLLEGQRDIANRAAGGQFEIAVPAGAGDPGQ
jgi:hypothetical protein